MCFIDGVDIYGFNFYTWVGYNAEPLLKYTRLTQYSVNYTEDIDSARGNWNMTWWREWSGGRQAVGSFIVEGFAPYKDHTYGSYVVKWNILTTWL